MTDQSSTGTVADAAISHDGRLVIVPYIRGQLREQTDHAVRAHGGPFHFHQLTTGDATGYARAFEGWWSIPADTMVIEQDIVPEPGMIDDMFRCHQPWCVRPYHIGDGRFATGLGMCKFSYILKQTFRTAGALAARNGTTAGRYLDWVALNESVERRLTRWGVIAHVHRPIVEHLHYPAHPDE